MPTSTDKRLERLRAQSNACVTSSHPAGSRAASIASSAPRQRSLGHTTGLPRRELQRHGEMSPNTCLARSREWCVHNPRAPQTVPRVRASGLVKMRCSLTTCAGLPVEPAHPPYGQYRALYRRAASNCKTLTSTAGGPVIRRRVPICVTTDQRTGSLVGKDDPATHRVRPIADTPSAIPPAIHFECSELPIRVKETRILFPADAEARTIPPMR
jgi:hypothetical protein